MDIKLTPTGITFTNDFELVVDNPTELAQRLLVRFKTQLGTWFLNTQYGLDYLNTLTGKGRTKLAIDTLIRLSILSEPLVQQLISFDSQIIGRRYACRFSVKAKQVVGEEATVRFILTDAGLFLTDEQGNRLFF